MNRRQETYRRYQFIGDYGQYVTDRGGAVEYPELSAEIYLNYQNLDLADRLGQNGHCSAGEGHEMYNPENEFVCTRQYNYNQ